MIFKLISKTLHLHFELFSNYECNLGWHSPWQLLSSARCQSPPPRCIQAPLAPRPDKSGRGMGPHQVALSSAEQVAAGNWSAIARMHSQRPRKAMVCPQGYCRGLSQGRANHEVHSVNKNTGIWEVENP